MNIRKTLVQAWKLEAAYQSEKEAATLAMLAAKEALTATLNTELAAALIGQVIDVPGSSFAPYAGKKMLVEKVGYYPKTYYYRSLPPMPRVYGTLLRKDGSVGKLKHSFCLHNHYKITMKQLEESQ